MVQEKQNVINESLVMFFMSLGQQRHQHWFNKNWPLREVMVKGKQNIINESLVK